MRNEAVNLTDGTLFDFWEEEPVYKNELFVDALSPDSSDDNDGSRESPFRTIQAAANVALPGTHIWINAVSNAGTEPYTMQID